MWADPGDIDDPEAIADILVPRLNLSRDMILGKLSKTYADGREKKFIWIERYLKDIHPEVLEDIETLTDGKVVVRNEPMRFYPQHDTASHLLGFVNKEGVGSEGVERAFNEYLKSEPGEYAARKDSRRRLLESQTLKFNAPTGGDSIQLTIDTQIQEALETALDLRIEERQAKRAMGILMNPHTGEIIALANRPAYDPNEYNAYDAALRKNSAIFDVFEPGSTFKMVTAAAALEHKIITPETVIDCENGYFNPYGHTISDHTPMAEAPFTLCFAKSSNIATIKVAALLGPERMEQWIDRFGFGQRTGGNFSTNESRGIFRPMNEWSRLTMGALPIGHEIAVTMPQLVRAYAAIANGGYLVEPYYVERAIARDGTTVYQHERKEAQRILSEDTARTMQWLCEQVVLTGSGKMAQIENYRVGGKTGTAEKPGKSGYSKKLNLALFAGFAPIKDPQIVAVIVVDEPVLYPRFGGYVCGPVFKQVVEKALILQQVPVDPVPRELLAGDGILNEGDLLFTRLSESESLAIEESLDDLLEPLDSLELVARNGDSILGVQGLPDFRGMTKQQVKKELWDLGIPWDPRGAGWVISQHPLPGTALTDVTLCSLEFGNRVAAPHIDMAAAEPASG